MDKDTEDRGTTRSGRKFSGAGAAGAKRKRSKENAETEPSCSRARMADAPPPPPASTNWTWEQFTTHLSKELAKNKDATVAGINTRLNANEANLNEYKKEMAKELNSIKADIATLSKSAGTVEACGHAPDGTPAPYKDALLSAASGSRTGVSEYDMKQYWIARRRIRIFPIDGDSTDAMLKGLEHFFFNLMRIPVGEVQQEDVVDVRRMRSGHGRKPRGEVLVTFSDVETRDRIATYARNLGDHVGKDGKPTAGVRPDVPSYLGGIHRALLHYGYDMRNRYGKELKRNVRFEDADHTFVIDLMIPGPNNVNKKWETVDYGQVCEDRRRKAAGKKKDERLSTTSDAETQNPPTTAPVVPEPSGSQMSNSTWGNR